MACAEFQAAATSGYPFGGIQASGAWPRSSVMPNSSSSALFGLAPAVTPSVRPVATTCSSGRRVFRPVAIQNSSDRNSTRSTGTIAVPFFRYASASRSTSGGGGLSHTNRTASLRAMFRAVAGCVARYAT